MNSPSTLVIQRGDLASLVLLLMQPDASKVIVWHPEGRTSAGRRRKACVEAVSTARGAGGLVVSELPDAASQGWLSLGFGAREDDRVPVEAHHVELRVLLDAAIVAKQVGCTRIISPWTVGPDHAQVGRAIERAMLVVELIDIEREAPELSIDLPLVERSDAELTELALDLCAPLMSFWPCEHGDESPCGECATCRRWISAFEEAGIAWPYEPVRSS